MRIGSLFSGIGGLELGLERAGVGTTIWQVEQDEFCRRVLAKHWPDVERFEDVCAVGSSTLAPVNLICGGFPCQDISSAGNREGLAGQRSGLWFEFARIIGELRPEWVVVENVASGANLWVDAVLAGLGEHGYQAIPFPLSAADCGAPHHRRRVFVVGRLAADGNGYELRKQSRGTKPWPQKTESDDDGEERVASDSNGKRLREEEQEAPAKLQKQQEGSFSSGGAWCGPVPEPCLRRMDDGVPNRAHRLRALGNAVVPQQAEVVGWIVRELAEEEK